MDQKSTLSVTKRKLRLVLALAVAVAVLAPVAVFAAGGTFTDDDSSIFEGDIEWMATNGITTGCGVGLYCPDDNVTRGQMAAFMKRLSQKKVVNAATAETAGDADTLGGYAPESLIRSAGAHLDSLGSPIAANATQSYLTVTINAPVDGFLAVNGSVNLFCSGLLTICVQSSGNTHVNVDGTQYARQYYSIDGGDSTANSAAWNASNNAYVPVTAGDHTVRIDVTNQSGSAGATYAWSGGINVIFTPFGSDGNGPAGATALEAKSGVEAGQN